MEMKFITDKPALVIDKCYSESPEPIMKCLKFKESKAYLLDGTFLGEIGKL